MARQPTQKAVSRKHMARLERERIQQRYLMIGAGVVIILVVGLILYGVLNQYVFENLRPVARVDGQNITTGAFQKEVRFDRHRSIQQLLSFASDTMMLQFFGSYAQQIVTRLNSPLTLGQEVLDNMIEDILVAREAEKRGITLSEAEVDQAFEQAFGFYADGTPTPTITATPFTFNTATLSATQLALVPPTATPAPTEAVSETATPEVTATPAETATLEPSATPETAATATPEASPTIEPTPTITPTPTQFTRELFETQAAIYVENASSIDFSMKDLRDYIRRQTLRTKVYEAITADVPANGEFVWARHILVPDQETAQQVIDRLQAGEDFAALANELSTDEGSKTSGGDLGWFTRGTMVAPFEEAVFALEIGESSQPVLSDFGYHVIQLLGREERPLDPQQLQEAKQRAYDDWLEQAKAAANIETFDRWTSVVPSDPEIPADILSILSQLGQ